MKRVKRWSSFKFVTISKVAGHALQVAMRLGGEVVPVAVDTDPAATRRLCDLWKQWDPGVDLRVLPSPHRTLVAPTVGFVEPKSKGRFVIVLLAYIEPKRRRYRILHNQRGPLLATTVRARTDAIVATLPIRLDLSISPPTPKTGGRHRFGNYAGCVALSARTCGALISKESSSALRGY